MLALINLALCLSSLVLFNSVPLIGFSADHESRPERCSRKVNCVSELAYVVEVLGILYEIVYKLGNCEFLSRDDKSTRLANASEVLLCQTFLL